MKSLLHLPPPLRQILLSSPQIRQILLSSPQIRQISTSPLPSSSPPPPSPPSSPLLLTPSTLNSYTHTPPPPTPLLTKSSLHFLRSPPVLLYSSPFFRDLPPSPFPEVAFLGRSNVGKSSLLNALFNRSRAGKPPAHVSKRAGRTRTINGFAISDGSQGKPGSEGPEGIGKKEKWKALTATPGTFVVVDMPGYGGGSREEWGVEALKFLRGRGQLRKTFVLVDAEHGVKASDVELLAHLRGEGVQVQVLVSKVDKVLWPKAKAPGAEELGRRLGKLREVVEEVRGKVEGATGEKGWLGDVLCFSAEKGLEVQGLKGKPKIGIAEVRWAVLAACGIGLG